MAIHIPLTLDVILDEYKRHQRRVRGLREVTLHGYEPFMRAFLRFSLGQDPLDPTLLTPADVVRFVASLRDRYSTRSMKAVRSALRSLLRFLRTRGYCDERLELAIPAVARWRMATLPRCLTEEQLQQVKAAFDPRSRCARRDRAIVLCLASLGLRPGELAALQLEDIDWRCGTIRLRTRKTRRGAVLPLPRDAGRSMATYLRTERPNTAERRVFIQHLGCRRGTPLSGNTVSSVAMRAFHRAGVESPLGGAYVFRHTVASRLVTRGAHLKEVADFLGHQCLDTTAIYAKLDLPALREVALPWPRVLP
jgi:integrase/recombinase XerD